MNKKQNTVVAGLSALALVATTSLVLSTTAYAATCGGVETSLIDCGDDGVMGILKLVVNTLTAGIGIAAVGAIVYAGILYTTSAGSSDQTKKAMGIISNVAVGILAYALMYLLLNFIIPGGVSPF